VRLPFSPEEILDNLRMERYPDSDPPEGRDHGLKKLYYVMRRFTSMSIRRRIQKHHARNWKKRMFPRWPVDTSVENICEKVLSMALEASGCDTIPFIWFWPKGAPACVIITHDVENERGRDLSPQLMDVDDCLGFKAAFQFVPEGRYALSPNLLDEVRARGFEVGIQDLNHDGRLYDDRAEFLRRVRLINRYGANYNARGFRAGVLYRRQEWYADLKFSFDMSIPNVAHLDPQHGGCCTVMPFFIGDILELPVTTTQDYTLFHLLDQRSTDLWASQIELILRKNGLISFIVHPDYVMDPENLAVYEDLLRHLRRLREESNIWCALPSEVDVWWRARSQMRLVQEGGSWRIEGAASDRAVLAYARKLDGNLTYELDNAGNRR